APTRGTRHCGASAAEAGGPAPAIGLGPDPPPPLEDAGGEGGSAAEGSTSASKADSSPSTSDPDGVASAPRASAGSKKTSVVRPGLSSRSRPAPTGNEIATYSPIAIGRSAAKVSVASPAETAG